MLKKLFLSVTLVFACTLLCVGKGKNVILRVTRAQQDTLGYNLLDNLPRLVYDAIQSNKVKVWDSPDKKMEITPSTIRDIEKSNGAKLSDLDNIFIYEIWTEKKKKVETSTLGILFATRNKKEQEITFGYVDYKDLDDLFSASLLPVNADGYLNMDIRQVLLSKRYDYSIVQYGSKLITNNVLSEKIKNDAFNKRTLAYTGEPVQQNKRVLYTIERLSPRDDKEGNDLILDSLQSYLQRNQEEYLNMGADKFDTYLNLKKVSLSKIEVVETWSRNQGGISYKPEQVVLYSNDFPLEPLDIARLNDWKINIGGKTIEEELRRKQFILSIIKINDQQVKSSEASKYQEALMNGSWSQVIEYVKQH